MKSILIKSALASSIVVMLASSAFALPVLTLDYDKLNTAPTLNVALLGVPTNRLIHADVRTRDGARVGFVTRVPSNQSLEVRINGQTKVLDQSQFHLNSRSSDNPTIVLN